MNIIMSTCFFLIFLSASAQDDIFPLVKKFDVQRIVALPDSIIYDRLESNTEFSIVYTETWKKRKKQGTRYVFAFTEIKADSVLTSWNLVLHKDRIDRVQIGWAYSKFPAIQTDVSDVFKYLWLKLDDELKAVSIKDSSTLVLETRYIRIELDMPANLLR